MHAVNPENEPLKWPPDAKLSRRKLEQLCDGRIIGSRCEVFEVEQVLDQIPALLPNNGKEALDEVLFINGAITQLDAHYEAMQLLANSGARVRGLHNGSYSFVEDFSELAFDRYDYKTSVPALSLSHLMRDAITQGKGMHLIGHSQGSAIINRAFKIIAEELKQQGLQRNEIGEVFKRFKVETYGSGVNNFIDGPRYIHVDNLADPVVKYIGNGFLSRFVTGRSAHYGKDARQMCFKEVHAPLPKKWKQHWRAVLREILEEHSHSPEIYFRRRRAFDLAYYGRTD